MADPVSVILKKTVPADLEKTKASLESLSKNSLKQTPFQFLPFATVTIGDQQQEGAADYHPDEKSFLLCTYNQVAANEYLSPHTQRVVTVGTTSNNNNYNVAGISVARPLPDDEREREIKSLEKATNEVWHVYTQLYYGWDGVGSVFFKRSTKVDFYMEGIFGVHKTSEDGSGGAWDSVHVVQVEEPNKSNGTCQYRVQSAVVLSTRPYEGTVISSSLQKETTKALKIQGLSVSASHLENLGKIIEDVEIGFRSKLERIDIPHSLDIVESMYQASQDMDSGAAVAGKHESEMPLRATGMSVGSTMIDDIASEAQKKKVEGNSFLDRMKAQQDAKEAQLAEQNKDYLATHHSSLRSAVPKTPLTPVTSPPFMAAKGVELKRSSLPKQLPLSAPTSPSPEFLNFRNKLKKTADA